MTRNQHKGWQILTKLANSTRTQHEISGLKLKGLNLTYEHELLSLHLLGKCSSSLNLKIRLGLVYCSAIRLLYCIKSHLQYFSGHGLIRRMNMLCKVISFYILNCVEIRVNLYNLILLCGFGFLADRIAMKCSFAKKVFLSYYRLEDLRVSLRNIFTNS
jgi:hypothetical protein